MPKPLSDMSVEEREQCVGMWAEMRSIRGIILGYEGKYVKLLCPTPERVRGDRELISYTHIGLTRLLPDLPRACTQVRCLEELSGLNVLLVSGWTVRISL